MEFAARVLGDRQPVVAEMGAPSFSWCVFCERGYRAGACREDGRGKLCPYPGCPGISADAWSWERVRAFNPGYPTEPERGVEYPMFSAPLAGGQPVTAEQLRRRW